MCLAGERIIAGAPPELAERVVVAGIASGDAQIARQVVAKLLPSATSRRSAGLNDVVFRLEPTLKAHLLSGDAATIDYLRQRRQVDA